MKSGSVMRIGAIAGVAAFVLVLGACGGSGKPAGNAGATAPGATAPGATSPTSLGAQAPDAVTIAMFTFTPGSVTVNAGSAITWTNADQILHTVTAGTGPGAKTEKFDGQLPDAGSSFTFMFDEPGVYEYFCSRHATVPGMHGTIVVT